MSAPTKREGTFSQLATFIPTDLKNRIAARAGQTGKTQQKVIEDALRTALDDRPSDEEDDDE